MKPTALLVLCAACAAAALAGPRSSRMPRISDYPDVSELPARPELPDPLAMLDGRKVTTRRQWERERRPELKRLFQHYMYGYLPAAPRAVRGTVEREAPAAGGKATLREVTLRFGPAPPIHLLLVLPNAGRRSPVFLGLNFCGNHAVLPDPGIRIPDGWMYPSYPGVVRNRATAAGRGTQADVWSVEKVVGRGYGVATFYNGDVDPDFPDFSNGVHPHYLRAGRKTHDPRDWGTIAAWAWGLSRAVDYLRTRPDVDPERIAVVGHSRNGKAALVAAAFDERIAFAIPHQAGCGGTAPSRGTVGESVRQINTAFPHWFNEEFKRFNDRPERLPFDQHCLAALAAPRPLLFSNAREDTWANPEGQFEVLQAASRVYRLLGAEGLGAETMPAPGRLVSSRLGYFLREGRHSMTPEDWDAFLAFADAQLPRR